MVRSTTARAELALASFKQFASCGLARGGALLAGYGPVHFGCVRDGTHEAGAISSIASGMDSSLAFTVSSSGDVTCWSSIRAFDVGASQLL